MSEEKSFLADRYYRNLVAELRKEGSGSEPWLVNALELLIDHADLFPPPSAEDAYVVEYVYPH